MDEADDDVADAEGGVADAEEDGTVVATAGQV